MSAFQSFSPVTSKTFCVINAPNFDAAAAVASTSSATLPPRTPATGRSSTGVLHFHSPNANIVVKPFAFGKLPNVADDTVKKFLGRRASVARDGSVQSVLREKCARSPRNAPDKREQAQRDREQCAD
jgi:hypothetical protein